MKIAEQTRHRSLTMLQVYSRRVDLFRDLVCTRRSQNPSLKRPGDSYRLREKRRSGLIKATVIVGANPTAAVTA